MRLIGGLVTILVALGLAPAARAETDQEKADQLFIAGRDLLKKGDAKGACEKFESAIVLDSTAPGVLLNLGLCYEKLGKLATSLRWYRKAQLAASEAKPTRLIEYEDAATARTAELAAKVAKIKLEIPTPTPGIELRIDGVSIKPDDYAKIEVDAGPHELGASAPNMQPFTDTFTIVDGEAKAMIVPPLNEIVVVVPTAPISRGKRRLAGVALAAGGTGLVIVSGVLANSTQNEFGKTGVKGDEPTGKMRLLAIPAVVGVAAIGFGAYLLFTKPRQQRRETAVAPVVTDDQLGFAVLGSF